MFNRKQNILAAALLMACAGGAFAAPSTDLKVTGTITPGSCVPSFVGPSELSYGEIKSQSLVNKPVGFNTLPNNKETIFNIQCDSKMAVGFSIIDQRSKPTKADFGMFGLALHNGKEIGGYDLMIKSVGATGDGKASPIITGWTQDFSTTESEFFTTHFNTNKFYALTDGKTPAAQSKPSAFTNHQYPIYSSVNIKNAEDLDLTNQIKIDGFVTFQLYYQ